jgi:hypothetical protein
MGLKVFKDLTGPSRPITLRHFRAYRFARRSVIGREGPVNQKYFSKFDDEPQVAGESPFAILKDGGYAFRTKSGSSGVGRVLMHTVCKSDSKLKIGRALPSERRSQIVLDFLAE